MPDYHITVHLKIGPPKKGIRWFASHDLERVNFLVAQKVKETIGKYMVDHIEVVMVKDQNIEAQDYFNSQDL